MSGSVVTGCRLASGSLYTLTTHFTDSEINGLHVTRDLGHGTPPRLAPFFTWLCVHALLPAFTHPATGPYVDQVTDTREMTSQ